MRAAQQAVVDAQNALLTQYDATTAALATASASQATAQLSCAAFTALDPTDADAATALAQCQADTSTALGDQQAAAAEQSTLMDKVTALNSAVTDLVNATSGTSSAAPAAYVTDTGNNTVVTVAAYTTSRVTTAADDFGGSGGSGSTSSSGGVPSAEDILADRADVAAAQADLLVAEAQLDYATLSTPVAGKVVSVGVASGDSVSAADTSTAITVIADNTYLVNLAVSLTQARMLSVGDAAQLTLLSDNQVVDGTVSSVGTVNSGNSFQQSYAVTIAVPDPGFEIRIGTATRMAITVASATGALVVPTSAVSDATGDATVQVIGDDGKAQTTSVTTGAVGSEYTEITSGLEKGQQVILADLSIKLSSGDDSSSSTGGLLSGLGDDSSTTDQRQFPGGGDFQPPDGFQPPAGFGGQGG
ncbi:MAG: HlyD family efflux transporter periplasmic adaptor subunit [Demequina sp.]|nr:HlyD family efflux transporter periplasmic adaptor subunit [Demequina sp.]